MADEVRAAVGLGGLWVDVGCDHGGLALTLLHEGGPLPRVVAVDRNRAPCAHARENARRLGLALDVREGDGLDPVPGFVDVVSICGMGSASATRILERAGERVGLAVVQPNDDARPVRAWASARGWTVLRERATVDRDRYYPVLVLAPGSTEPPDAVELAWGPRAQVDVAVLVARIESEIARLCRFPGREPELRVAREALARLPAARCPSAATGP